MSEADWLDNYDDSYDDDICDGYWVTKNGNSIRITDMTTPHLRNTINLLRKRGLAHSDMYKQMSIEFLLRK